MCRQQESKRLGGSEVWSEGGEHEQQMIGEEQFVLVGWDRDR